MADMNYSIGVNTSNAQQQVKGLLDQVQMLNQGFSKLKEVVAGFTAAGFIKSLYEQANALVESAKAANVSTQALMGFAKAVAANGGDYNRAIDGIDNFSQALAGAIQGSKASQDAMLKMGISLKELATLSEDELLKRIATGLGGIKDPSVRAATAIEIFGKAAKGVDFAGVANDIDKFTEKSKDAAGVAERASAVNQSLNQSYGEFKTQLMAALDPIAKLAEMILSFKDTIALLMKILVDVGLAFAVFKYAVGPIRALQGEMGAVIAEGTSFKEVFSGMGSKLTKPFVDMRNSLQLVASGFTGTIEGAKMGYTVLERLGVVVGGLVGFFGRLLGVVSLVWAAFDILNGIVKTFTGNSLMDWGEKALKAMGLISQTSKEKEAMAKKAQEQADAERKVVDAMAQEKLALDKIVAGYQLANAEYNKKFRLDTQNLSVSEAQKLLTEEQFAAEKEYLTKITDLKDQYVAKSKSGSQSDLSMLPEIQSRMAQLTTEYEKQTQAIKEQVAERVKGLAAEQFRLFSVKESIDAQNKLQAIQDDMAKSTMTELEKKYYDIDAAARDSAKSAIQAEEARRKAKLDPKEIAAYVEEAKKGSAALKQAAEEQYNYSRSFSTGWAQAFNNYVDNATNAAESARRIFDKFASGIEDMFVNLFKTGKLDWKQFLASIAEEILRSNIKLLLAQLFAPAKTKNLGTAGAVAAAATGSNTEAATKEQVVSIFDGMKNVFTDFTNTATNFMSNMFGGLSSLVSSFISGTGSLLSMIGSTLWDLISGLGGNLMSIIGSLGSSLGDVLSGAGSLLGGGGGGGGFLSSAIDFVGGLFGFAGGGVIPNNGPVIVGEKGPELLFGSQGSAVVPLNGVGAGGATNITYNINAVDALSFKQMIAADPTFLYAVTMQGAKSMPIRR